MARDRHMSNTHYLLQFGDVLQNTAHLLRVALANFSPEPCQKKQAGGRTQRAEHLGESSWEECGTDCETINLGCL